MQPNVIFSNSVGSVIDSLSAEISPASVFVVTDDNVKSVVLPVLQHSSKVVAGARVISVAAGDSNKNLDSLSHIWKELSDNGATRSSLVINVGGGMITDMGAFAAATFKRGVRFINVPTTLLAAVDASVGGKTGINFNSLKNEIGAFAPAEATIISTTFFKTLPTTELLSGYAEMLKHSLLESPVSFAELIAFDISDTAPDDGRLLDYLQKSVGVKSRIVTIDPTEKGLRKSLNLGHTAGHAFESFALASGKPVPHGFAVAWGMVVELVLSSMELGFPSSVLRNYAAYVRSHYGTFDITCKDYPRLLELMAHDKKNVSSDRINFTLLRNVGDVQLDCVVKDETIKNALDIYRDLMGI